MVMEPSQENLAALLEFRRSTDNVLLHGDPGYEQHLGKLFAGRGVHIVQPADSCVFLPGGWIHCVFTPSKSASLCATWTAPQDMAVYNRTMPISRGPIMDEKIVRCHVV